MPMLIIFILSSMDIKIEIFYSILCMDLQVKVSFCSHITRCLGDD